LREIILIGVIAALTGCGAVGNSASNMANGANVANAGKAANKTLAVPQKTSEPFAMHSAPKLIELMKKYPDSLGTTFKGKDFIVIGRASRVDSSGIYFTQSLDSITCEMSSVARADEKFSTVEAAVAKSQQPIVEVRGTFAGGSVSTNGASGRLADCTIVSLGGETP